MGSQFHLEIQFRHMQVIMSHATTGAACQHVLNWSMWLVTGKHLSLTVVGGGS